MTRKTIFLEWLQVAAGLFVFAFGVHLTIFANIGVGPWDCLGMGIANHTPLNYGMSMVAVSVVIVGIDVAMKEHIGFGTLIDALLTGNLVQMFNDLNPFPLNESLWPGLLIMTAGFVFLAVGMWIYMKACQGCGPRDALLVACGKRLPKVPIGFVQILQWAVVALAGGLLGGPIGIGTLYCTFGAGAVMQAVYSLIRFEPRALRHKGVPEVLKLLLKGEQSS